MSEIEEIEIISTGGTQIKSEFTEKDFSEEWYNNHRIISLLDMDSFYAQVERRRMQEEGIDISEDNPIAVIQRTICATVNHTARLRGVPKMCTKEEAMRICPEIVTVTSVMSRYKEASAQILKTLTEMFPIVERSSIDESYVDLTPQCIYVAYKLLFDVSTIEGQTNQLFIITDSILLDWKREIYCLYRRYENMLDENLVKFATDYGLPPLENLMLGDKIINCLTALPGRIYPDECGEQSTFENRGVLHPTLENLLISIGTRLMAAAKRKISQKHSITSAAGISTNKLLAKLACPLNKPNNLTIVRPEASILLVDSRGLKRIPMLGPKLLEVLKSLNIREPSQIRDPENRNILDKSLPYKDVAFLIQRCSAIDRTPVAARALQKSLTVEAAVRPIHNIKAISELLRNQTNELIERLIKDERENSRRASSIVLRYRNQRWHGEFNDSFDFGNENTALNKTMRLDPTRVTGSRPYSAEELFPMFFRMFLEACPREPYHITLLGVGVKDFVKLVEYSRKEKIDFYFKKKEINEIDEIEEIVEIDDIQKNITVKNENLIIRCSRCNQLLYTNEMKDHANTHLAASIEKFFIKKRKS